jgi:hypothetical protein
MIGKDLINYASGLSGFQGVGVYVFGKCNQALPQCPAATSLPGRVIDWKRCAERFPAFS